MSLKRTMQRKIYRQTMALDTLEGLGKLPNTASVTLALAGNTFSGARRRMARIAAQQAVRLSPAEQARLDEEYE